MLHFLDKIIPCQCLLCGSSSHSAFCLECDAALPRWQSTKACPRCAEPGTAGHVCGACLQKPPAFDAIHAAFLYQSPLSELIQAAKFGGQWSLLTALGDYMPASPHVPDILIPMPLHPKRLRERGFNQSQELARILTGKLGIPSRNHWLLRIRDTEHQARLHARERRKNLRNAFACTPRLDGLSVALIDDVMTSGASLEYAARVLKQAGATYVEGWVLARTPPLIQL